MTDNLPNHEDLPEKNVQEHTTDLAKVNRLPEQEIEESRHAERLAHIAQLRKAEEALQNAYAEIQALRNRLPAEDDYLRGEITPSQPHGIVISESKAMKEALNLVHAGGADPFVRSTHRGNWHWQRTPCRDHTPA